MYNGFINVHKPVGATASDVVVKLRYILREKQIGHLGTLDPGACGVLPIAVGQGTKLFNLLATKQKIYRAFFTFGKTTDTLDAYGKLTEKSKIPTQQCILEALKGFVGGFVQVPPQYSAISVAGTRAYDLARKGVQVELKGREVFVKKFELLRQVSVDTYMFDIHCSGGTYIRSLARDLANATGSVGYMSGLIRLQSGSFLIENALTFEEIENLKEKSICGILTPFADMPIVEIDDKYFKQFDNGIKVPVKPFDGYAKIFCKQVFFGIGKHTNGKIHLEYYLKNAES